MCISCVNIFQNAIPEKQELILLRGGHYDPPPPDKVGLNALKRLMKTSTLYLLSHSDVLYIGRATHYCQYKHFVNLKIDHGGQANTAYIIL